MARLPFLLSTLFHAEFFIAFLVVNDSKIVLSCKPVSGIDVYIYTFSPKALLSDTDEYTRPNHSVLNPAIDVFTRRS